MSESGKDIAVILAKLVLVSLVAAALLGITFVPTQEQLKINAIEQQKMALAEIFPQATEFEEVYGTVPDEEGELPVLYYRALDSSGNLVGYAFFQDFPGSQGQIRIAGGIDPSFSTVAGVQVMKHSETPGLGAKIVETDFRDQFLGVPLADMALSKDGGKIDAITGASISSQAVVDALKAGIDSVKEQES
ncbi:electron transport complex protein RnfG [Methanohalophilus levihalophilus]|uniref:Rnf electron transport complex subunit RnfG n=1 Tax=Methanohalophilus levihalophilus TaxID=1431282 RepID=UPI001AE0FE47|nr:Rnf electron transport complex subunit RnfG [Methanohalophilus levihalophilus]MBP2030883.1 electron transport complex protein RnfG [Methanohalophilus levihalophilus]